MLMLKKSTTTQGFTIVELLIVVVVIAILAAITIVSYNGIQNRARTVVSLSTVAEVRDKATIWSSMMSSYPDLAQLRTNSVSPPDMDTAGGATGPIEAKLSNPGAAIGASLDEVRADGGRTVHYEPCWGGLNLSGARITYMDYTATGSDRNVTTVVGSCP